MSKADFIWQHVPLNKSEKIKINFIKSNEKFVLVVKYN
jgi:pyrimidine operon attenuation protein/uracil phosphoribosyltransferase